MLVLQQVNFITKDFHLTRLGYPIWGKELNLVQLETKLKSMFNTTLGRGMNKVKIYVPHTGTDTE